MRSKFSKTNGPQQLTWPDPGLKFAHDCGGTVARLANDDQGGHEFCSDSCKNGIRRGKEFAKGRANHFFQSI